MFEERNNCCIKFKRCCVDLILFILSILFAFIIGIILGATTGIFTSLGVGAFVATSVILGILILIRTIMLVCFGVKKDKRENDDYCR